MSVCVCVIKVSLILDNDFLIGTRKLSHTHTGEEIAHILSSESHQTTYQQTATHYDSRPPPPLSKCVDQQRQPLSAELH